MFEIVLYAIFSCFLITLVATAMLVRARRSIKRFRDEKDIARARLIGRRTGMWLVVLLLLPLLPYARVETQTALAGESLKPAVDVLVEQELGYDTLCWMKVLSITPWRAKVYVVSRYDIEGDTGYSGVVFVLNRRSGHWENEGRIESCAFSDRGSADGNIFPPYPKPDD